MRRRDIRPPVLDDPYAVMPATSIDELHQRWPKVVVRGSQRSVWETSSGKTIRTIVEIGTQGHVQFLGRVRLVAK